MIPTVLAALQEWNDVRLDCNPGEEDDDSQLSLESRRLCALAQVPAASAEDICVKIYVLMLARHESFRRCPSVPNLPPVTDDICDRDLNLLQTAILRDLIEIVGPVRNMIGSGCTVFDPACWAGLWYSAGGRMVVGSTPDGVETLFLSAAEEGGRTSRCCAILLHVLDAEPDGRSRVLSAIKARPGLVEKVQISLL